ncbi:hypothetical protein TRFO_22674 [Tritrichomonas foetus]|uniref:Uncharacterized protein n=1 Tax=Tritrichomonas foetus TaxID=1144522 RepID=A0A1J4KG59_9EUKA|nr:hypothetical protein TRFO_22674 [Tritrichomonas foetus]|eukprot:OHT08756.1 hypothetical protein TRFO_22674 [Tritrichomonas foetus]
MYLIKDDCSILITKSVTYHFPDFKVEIVKKSNYFKTYIHKLDNQHQYCIFLILDGNNNFHSESNFDTKSLFCTSYSNHRMSNKFYIIHVALLCNINEFMNTILLDEGENKRWTVERASTIIRYINLNIRDALEIANSSNYVSLDDHLFWMIQRQLSSEFLNTTTKSFNNRRFSFILCLKDFTRIHPIRIK